ncbi:universal stress protein [Paenibacillus sacheonensis]|uniref:Universal stress protein n=1 Tax=Paenibacillus sacheonensis TaxID=742054 RepID=A0A7X5BZ13_9BACL|nr:universal stress protein [Paenibacillus sacheonensis]MBM7564980.1 nucleotide-binding universal stress UspA family protein [Paenibacillus sacheonensis]NBC70232.1 universal stress protein [Paenibacillus sacheonensis]
MFTNILVAYDGSNLSKKALNKAVEFFRQSEDARPSKLEILHVFQEIVRSGQVYFVVDEKVEKEYNEKVFDEVKAMIPPDIRMEYFKVNGDPARTILEHADKHGNDLIVMGSRGLGKIREVVLGSVSHNVAQHAKVPVLIIK